MNNLINILIILLIIFLFSYFYYNYNLTINKKCWINNDLFPQANEIFNSKNVIKDELNSILDNDNWAIWSNDYKKTPNFSNMNQDDIIKRLNNNSSKINSSEKENRRNPPKSNCFENFKISLKFFFSENKFLEIKYIKQITNLKTTSI
jgi:hypothetical protein